MNWIYKIILRNKQKALLFEMKKDIEYLEVFKSKALDSNEDDLRIELGEINELDHKEKETKVDRLKEIVDLLSELKVVKQRYASTKNNIKELEDYIDLLK